MTYARARLYLGISGVGCLVTFSAAALWSRLPERFFLYESSAEAIAWTMAVYILFSSPFDLLGGYLLPRLFHRTDLSLSTFLMQWLRGVVMQATIMALCLFCLLETARRAGTLAGIGVFVLLMLVLLGSQLQVAKLTAALRPGSVRLPLPSQDPSVPGFAPDKTLFVQSTDPAFVGGLVGFPGSVKLVLPADWLTSLPASTVTMQLSRRQAALVTGARARGVALALLWNLAGFVLALQMPGASLKQAAGLITTGLWCTLWSFLGLLLLPTLNRPGVLEADRFASEHGITQESMQRGMTELDRLQDDEPDRSKWIERVFHPIPSVTSRMQALGQKPARGAWQGARLTLYLSWACCGFLSRAVHCNSGRPELWVLFPGD